ncbi:MAG: gluconate 2-dehydrogenase subunit 3 family protein [Dehalococcoidia bacterium]
MIFTSHQRAAIEAATSRIIPADRDPGALEAGVVDYIEQTLATYGKHAAQLYFDGLRELDELARSQFGAETFSSLQPEQQDRVLTILEERESPFFSLLVEHTMEGFYGDPRHGGNKNRVGWTILDFSGPSYPEGYPSPIGWYDGHLPDEFASPKKKNG